MRKESLLFWNSFTMSSSAVYRSLTSNYQKKSKGGEGFFLEGIRRGDISSFLSGKKKI